MGTALLRLLVRMSTASKTHPFRGHPIARSDLLLMPHQWICWSHGWPSRSYSPHRPYEERRGERRASFERLY